MRSPFSRRSGERPADARTATDRATTDTADPTGGTGGTEDAGDNRPARRPRYRRPGVLIGGGVLVLLLVAIAWLLVTGLLARRELLAVKADLPKLRAALSHGDIAGAQRIAQTLDHHAQRAHDLTTGPAWATAAAVPFAGDPLDTVRVVAREAQVLTHDALPGVIKVADTLNGSSLRHGASINLGPLEQAVPVLDHATGAAGRAAKAVGATPSSTWLGSVDDGRSSLLHQLDKLSSQLTGAEQGARILPTMLGQHGVKRYFVTFENDAESRGIGGLPGAFVIITADHGKVTFSNFESDVYLDGVSTKLDFGQDFRQKYAKAVPTATYANSDISPHYPYAAQIWAAMWQAKTGQRIDGAVALDPTALSYLLLATGPAPLPDGGQVGAGNVVSLTQQRLYKRFPDTQQRKAFLVQLAKAVSRRLIAGGDTPALVRGGARAASERRLLVWSRDPAVESVLERYNFAGTVKNTGRPYTGFVVNNASGSKLDYYLHRTMAYHRTGCGAGSTSTATFTMTNGAPASGLPSYVTIRADDKKHKRQLGSNLLLVSYYASAGSKITSVTLNGKKLLLGNQPENGLVSVTTYVNLRVAQTLTLKITVDEPPARGPLQVLEQPGVNPMPVTISGDSCR